jgi:hypothetical protein
MTTEADCFFYINGDTREIEEYFSNNFNDLNWHEHESLWNLALLPYDVLMSNKFLSDLNNVFEIEGAGFIKMDPNESYKWHLDFSRGVAINMLMNPKIYSLCLFEQQEINKERVKYLELMYPPNKFVLFNTQINHTIITFEETRYLFTVQFKKPKEELSYYDIRNYLQSLT